LQVVNSDSIRILTYNPLVTSPVSNPRTELFYYSITNLHYDSTDDTIFAAEICALRQ